MTTFLRKNAILAACVTPDKYRALSEAHTHLAAHPELAASYVTHTFDISEA